MKQELCRQHSTMSLIKYQNRYPKSGLFLKKSNFTKKMIPKNPGIAQKGTQKSGSTPKSTQNNGTSPYHDICKLIPPPPHSSQKRTIRICIVNNSMYPGYLTYPIYFSMYNQAYPKRSVETLC